LSVNPPALFAGDALELSASSKMKKLATQRQEALVCAAGTGQEAQPAVHNVDRAMTKGALWMVLARLGDRSLGFVSTIIIVRLLAPADFGLVAMAMSVIAICELFGQVGLDVALIHNPDVTRRHYDTAWTFSVILSAVTAVVLLVVAFPAAKFYGEPRLLPIVLSLALGSLISGFENIGVVAFRKRLRFDKEFQFIFGKKLASFAVTVLLAVLLRNYWALIAGIVVGRLAAVCLSYYVQEYRPRWSLEASHELFHFSKWMLINNFVTVFNSRAADFIVGKVAGVHALGLFNVSYELSNLPTSELIAPVNRAVFPGYARKSADISALQQGYLNVIGIIAAVGVPAGVGIAATAGVLVPLIFGPQWTEAIPLVAILAIYGVIAAMKTNAHYVYLALGRPNIAAYLGLMQISMLLPTLVLLSMKYGVTGAAYAYLVSQAVFTPFSFWALFKTLDITVHQLLRVLWRPVVSATLMFAVVRLVLPRLPLEPIDNITGFAHLMIAVLSGAVAYVSCLYALWTISARPAGAESLLLGFVQSTKLRSWFSSVSVFSR
jgi:O-antigen/teichoic acid export membrane protein